MSDEALRLANAIVGEGLPGRSTPARRTVDEPTWQALRSVILGQRISGPAVASVEAGWLDLTERQTGELLSLHHGAMAWALHVERKLLALADILEREKVRFAVLKGASVAHTAYEDPSLRAFGDIDLLVGTADYERSCRILARAGHVRQRPEPRAHFEIRFGKASVHKHPDDDVEIDLHRTLVLGPYGLWIEPDELLARAVPFEIGGRQLNRLDDAGLFFSVAMHAALGFATPRLVPIRDTVEVATNLDPDPATLMAWSSRWRLAGVFRNAAHEARLRLGADAPMLMMFERQPVPARDERVLSAYTANRHAGGTALATLKAIPGPRAKTAYVWALAMPSRDFLHARSPAKPSYLQRWRRGINRLRPDRQAAGA